MNILLRFFNGGSPTAYRRGALTLRKHQPQESLDIMLTPGQVITKLEAGELPLITRVPRNAQQTSPPAGIAGSSEDGWIGVVFEDGQQKSVSEWTNSRPDGAEADLERDFARRAESTPGNGAAGTPPVPSLFDQV